MGAKLAISPTRPVGPASATASSIMASFGFNTGIGASSVAQASMQGPKAEHVKRIASAPQPFA